VTARKVEPEILDELAVTDPRAIHSRRDLQRVNALMGHRRIVTRAVESAGGVPGSLVELGAGDGTFLLRVARRLKPSDGRVRAILVDRRPSLSAHTRSAFRAIGWDVETRAFDVLDWLTRPGPETVDVMLANLFLHHFTDSQLVPLLAAASGQTRHFIACEPLRSRTALAGASLLGAIGCNEVTTHDGKVSVRAGFQGRELSQLWPGDPGWVLKERRAGPFSHLFVAQAAPS
jgi:hypothetical protein